MTREAEPTAGEVLRNLFITLCYQRLWSVPEREENQLKQWSKGLKAPVSHSWDEHILKSYERSRYVLNYHSGHFAKVLHCVRKYLSHSKIQQIISRASIGWSWAVIVCTQ